MELKTKIEQCATHSVRLENNTITLSSFGSLLPALHIGSFHYQENIIQTLNGFVTVIMMIEAP